MGLSLDTAVLGNAAARYAEAREYAAAGAAALSATTISGSAFGDVPSASALSTALNGVGQQHQLAASAAGGAMTTASERLGTVLGLATSAVSETTKAAGG